MNQAEALTIAACAFEVVEQRPADIAVDIDTVVEAFADLGQRGVEIGDAARISAKTVPK